MYKASKRYVDLKTAATIAAAAKRGGAIPVAVCVNQTAQEIIKLCNDSDISVVQLHGDVSREQQAQLPEHITRIYVLHVDQDGKIINYNENLMKDLKCERDFILFDGLVGGSGESIITDNIQAAAGAFRFFIAGGLTNQNVSNVINRCTPYAVDVSTGVENRLGEKALSLIEDFIFQVNTIGEHR